MSEKNPTSNSEVSKLNKVIKKAIIYFKPPEQLTVTEWADKYRWLSAENSAEPGRWKTSRTPYLKEIMDSFTDTKVHHLVVVASSQVGKTEMELNMMGYAIDIDPGPIMFVVPNTKPIAEDFSKRRIAPMIRDTKSLRDKVADVKSRESNNTIFNKSYPGGMLTITGANSPSNLASIPCRYVFGDERDRWPKSAGTEGDPWRLVEARTNTFYNYKMVEVSTPTIKGASNIEDAFNTGTQEHWCVQCPHCGEYFFITFNNIRYETKVKKVNGKKQFKISEINCACPHCGCASSEQVIRKQPKKWIAENPDAYDKGVRSFWINAFASPWMTWEKIILKFLEAGTDPEKLKTVYNTLFGQLWEDRSCETDEAQLLARRELYHAELPEGVLCLTCGVDTQGNRLEYEVVGYGFHEENWGIEKGIIMGDPAENDTWERLDGVIDRSYSFADSKKLKISVTFVDSGGNRTQEVYEQCNKRLHKRVFAIKGKSADGIPYVSFPKKVNILKGKDRKVVVGTAWLYTLGVDAGKDHIMSGLDVKEPGSRYSHFPLNDNLGYDESYFAGLLSEKMTYVNGKWKWEIIPGHERNEALDCRNYANAAFKSLRPNLDRIYRMLKDIVPEEKPKPKKRYKSQKQRQSFDDDW